MTLVHLHLLLNHLPVVGIPLAGALLVSGIAKRNDTLQRTAFAFLLFLAVMTIPVFLSGEPAEESVEHLPGVAETMIERHEDLASVAMGVTALLGVVALVGLVAARGGRAVPRGLAYAGLAATLLAVAVLTPTAYFGGQIRHSEIRADTPAAGTATEDLERSDDGR